MKKTILTLFLFAATVSNAFAIDWQVVYSKGVPVAYVDKDSIQKTDSYYFFNVKHYTSEGKFIILTIQSALNSPFCKSLKTYTEEEYEALAGNYDKLQDNISTSLDPTGYGSLASACFNFVRTYDHIKNQQIKIGKHNQIIE